ncbi:hypothetical protein C8R45DRAFT_930529 [Mycena sanguinolenta]|nr:hypothetical protein C8R45DRAFT_930529 [Mycena sanguinolenta]
MSWVHRAFPRARSWAPISPFPLFLYRVAMRVSGESTSSSPPYDSPRYVYYRVYASYGAIPSKRAPDSTQPFIGSIKATSVPPPLNVASLKRTLVHAEGIPDLLSRRSQLYHHFLGAETPMADADTVEILGLGADLAATPTDAMALVFCRRIERGGGSKVAKDRRPEGDSAWNWNAGPILSAAYAEWGSSLHTRL